MNTPISSNNQEELVQKEHTQEDSFQLELENKKRKVRVISNGLKADIMNHFKAWPKVPKASKSLLALKKSTYTSTIDSEGIVDLMDLVYTGLAITYLYLIVDILLDRDYMKRYRVVLSRLFSSIKATNLQVIILLYEVSSQ